jgi:uncharacterized protein YcnI
MLRVLIRGLALAVVGVIGAAAPAFAHVEVSDSSVEPDGQATVAFSFHHGCAGEPTTSLRIQVPQGVSDVRPQPVDGWQTASDANEFSWTGGSVPDGDEATFTATMRVTGTAGTTVWFPTVQGCPNAEEAWIEIPATGGAEPDNVAPSIVLATTLEATTTAPTTTEVQPSTTRTTLVPGEAAVTKEGSPQNSTGLVVGLVAVGAIVVGASVLYFRYRGRGNTTKT